MTTDVDILSGPANRKVNISDFIKAVKGEPFWPIMGLMRLEADEIKTLGLFEGEDILIEDDFTYVILYTAIIVDVDEIIFPNIEKEINTGVIFFNSIVPKIILSETKIGSLYFSKSLVKDIEINCKATCGSITITNHSSCGKIIINKSSQCESIAINKKSICNAIEVSSKGRNGDTFISDNSYIELIEITGGDNGNIIASDSALVRGIKVKDNTNAFDIKIAENSDLGFIEFVKANLQKVYIKATIFSCKIFESKIISAEFEGAIISEFILSKCTQINLSITNNSTILYFQISEVTLQKENTIFISGTIVYFVIKKTMIFGQLSLHDLISSEPNKIATLLVTYQSRGTIFMLRKGWGEKPMFDASDLVIMNNATFKDRFVSRCASESLAINKNRWNEYGFMPVFKLWYSSLGKAEIFGCDLSAFVFIYNNSKIIDCCILGTLMPKKNITTDHMLSLGIVWYKIDNKNDDYLKSRRHYKINTTQLQQKIILFNQYKKIYENQGDKLKAMEFETLALNTQQALMWGSFFGRIIKENVAWPYRIIAHAKRLFHNIGFSLNWLSNNNGDNWIRAALFIIIASIIFFSMSLWGLTHNYEDYQVLISNIHKLPGFVLPTHAIDYLSKDLPYEVTLSHTMFDFLGRIFIGYGIFQFVTAFRNFSKKGGL